MAKDDPKKNTKDAKNAKTEAPKNDWKEQTKPDSGGTASNNSSCSSIAKVLIYLIPLALYVPWAYRMFKGNACCSEVPKCPTASMSQSCTASGNTSFSAPLSRLGERLREPKGQHQPSCSESCNDGGDIQDCDGGKGKANNNINIDKEREECLEQSKQCLEKCMEKCFDADRVEKKKKKKRKERKCDEDEDD